MLYLRSAAKILSKAFIDQTWQRKIVPVFPGAVLVEQPSQIWQTWADSLNRWGLQNLTAAILDALGPLNLLGAQVVYLGQPLMNSFLPEDHLDALANLLENPKSTQAFVSILRRSDDHPQV